MTSVPSQAAESKPEVFERFDGGPETPAIAAQIVDLFRPPGAPTVSGKMLTDPSYEDSYCWQVDGWQVDYIYAPRGLWITWGSFGDGGCFELYRCGTRRYRAPMPDGRDITEKDYQLGWPGTIPGQPA